MGAGGTHEAVVVAVVRTWCVPGGADRRHRGRRPDRSPAHDPRQRGGRPLLHPHADLAPSLSGGVRSGATPMTPLLLTYCALALPYLTAAVRLALTRSGARFLP